MTRTMSFWQRGFHPKLFGHSAEFPESGCLRRLLLSGARPQEEGRSIRDMARSLNCRYILTGTLRHAGKMIRVTAELTDAQHETLMWL